MKLLLLLAVDFYLRKRERSCSSDLAIPPALSLSLSSAIIMHDLETSEFGKEKFRDSDKIGKY